MPTYSAFEKFDAEGAVESISGYLPPRLRSETKVFDDFDCLREAIGTAPQDPKKEQVLLLEQVIWIVGLTRWRLWRNLEVTSIRLFQFI